MDNGERASIDLLAWRIKQLEIIETAMRVELHELRHELPDRMLKSLREDYYSKAETRNRFVTREELSRHHAERRQWPVIVAAIAASTVSLADLLIRLAGG